MQRIYKKGIDMCKRWAVQHDNVDVQGLRFSHSPKQRRSTPIRPLYEDSDSQSSENDRSSDTDDGDIQNAAKNRYFFDGSMIDILGRIIILKIYSHQLTKDFKVKDQGRQPKPNYFITSANQWADNAATQAKFIISHPPPHFDQIFYPPFSPRWCYTFEGCIINKGATKLLYTQLDDELSWRLQNREKHGLLCRLLAFNGLNADFIGNESMNLNIAKTTAPSWTRIIYRHPSMAGLIWKRWYNKLTPEQQENTPAALPHGWQKTPNIADNVIKQCPCCQDLRHGDLEHLHLYCKAAILQNARVHCRGKIEIALQDLYAFVTRLEFGNLSVQPPRRSTLQEKLECAAKEIEKQERLVLHQTRLLTEARLPAENLQNYNSFPLAHRLGLIHSIPEYNFSMAKATIIDAIFLGLFPKGLIQVLQTYAQRFKNSRTADEQTFTNLMNKLITAVIYRPITMQKAIQNMLARERQDLELECSQRLNSTSTQPSSENTIMIIPPRGNLIVRQPTHAISTTSQICKTCYATRCRLLPAKGNHTRNMYCAPRKNMCSGCISESIRQKKAAQLERDI